MTNDTRTPDQIERDIENEREELSGSINDLQQKFSVENIVRDVGDMFRGQNGELGGAFGQSIKDTIGRNPAATTLTVVGLAWMFLGPFGGNGQRRDTSQRANWRNGSKRGGASQGGWASGEARPGVSSERYGHNDAHWYSDDTRKSTTGGYGRSASTSRYPGSRSDQQNGGSSDSGRGGTGSIGGSMSEAAGGLRERAHDLKDRLAHGTENLSEDARARVVAARQAAHDARVATEAAMNRGGRAAADVFEDHPLVVGALAVALGAAIGSALPHSRMEDDAMGESSDRLFHEAQAVFHEEREKAMAVVGAAADEAKDVISETGSDLADKMPDAKSTGDAIKERASDAGTRVANEARDEAGRQGLGPRKA